MIPLLVSVRSPLEAQLALRAGAALIDVKEPARGSLGRADDALIAGVVRAVAGRRTVSAALGELVEYPALPHVEGLSFVKWGLAGTNGSDWRKELCDGCRRLQRALMSSRPVAVAYADWQRATAPPPEEVVSFAVEYRWPVVLVDTWQKDGKTLFDWLTREAVTALRLRCRLAGVRVALAGSLGFDDIAVIRELQPDWLAVRGAVCRYGKRTETIEPARMRRLVKALTESSLAPATAEG